MKRMDKVNKKIVIHYFSSQKSKEAFREVLR